MFSTPRGVAASDRRIGRIGRVAVAVSIALLVPVTAAAADPCSTTTPCSQTVSTSGGAMTNPVVGLITLSGLTPSRTYTLVDALQALPNGGIDKERYFRGSYDLALSNCSAGTGTGSTYNVGPNLATTAFPAGIPPMTAGGLASVTTGPGGDVACRYSVSFTVSPLTSVVSVRSDLFLMNGSAGVVHLASVSVGAPPMTPPPGVPEAPLMILLPVLAIALFGLAFLWEWRRQATAAIA